MKIPEEKTRSERLSCNLQKLAARLQVVRHKQQQKLSAAAELAAALQETELKARAALARQAESEAALLSAELGRIDEQLDEIRTESAELAVRITLFQRLIKRTERRQKACRMLFPEHLPQRFAAASSTSRTLGSRYQYGPLSRRR